MATVKSVVVKGGDDGKAWSARRSHRIVETKKEKLCLIGGFVDSDSSGDVWICHHFPGEADRMETIWSRVTDRAAFRGRDGHAAVLITGAILVLGGASSDVDALTTSEVWQSTDDGVSWHMVTSAPGWPARTYHEAVAMKGVVYILGGFGEFGYCNDVWRSLDGGLTWDRTIASASWSPRAMHAAATFRGAIYVTGGYERRGSCNDVWASTDAVTWTRLSSHAPWRPRRGHTLTAAGESCLIITGGESGSADVASNESFGDCWTSHDGACWSLVCFDAPPRHFHAAIFRTDMLFVFGGAEAAKQESRIKVHAGGWAVAIGVPALITMKQASSSPLDISMRSVVEAISQLRQLRAALREVQRGNVQLARYARDATCCYNIKTALLGEANSDSAPGHNDVTPIKPATAQKKKASSIAARLHRAWSNCKTGGIALFETSKATSYEVSQPTTSKLSHLESKDEDDDDLSIVPTESCSSFFDARAGDTDSEISRNEAPPSSPTFNNLTDQKQVVEIQQEAPIAAESVSATDAEPLRESVISVIEDAFAVDASLYANWCDNLWPLYRDIGAISLSQLDRPKLATYIERRDGALKALAAEAVTAETKLLSLVAASRSLRQRVSTALSRIRIRIQIELNDTCALGATQQREVFLPQKIKSSASFTEVRDFALASIQAESGVQSRDVGSATSHLDERDDRPRRLPGDEAEIAICDDCEDCTITSLVDIDEDWFSTHGRVPIQAPTLEVGESFEEVVADLRAHCTRPERANSARRATDTALARLADALQKRADAADALRASINYIATNKQENDDSTKVEEEVSLGTLAAATLWDEGASLIQCKLDAHEAVGGELSIIPRELEHALALKAKLLRAVERRCCEALASARILLAIATLLRRRASAWREYLEAYDRTNRAASLCEVAAFAQDRVIRLEDQKVDILSELTKLKRRRRGHGFRHGRNEVLGNSYSSAISKTNDDTESNMGIMKTESKQILLLTTGVVVAPTDPVADREAAPSRNDNVVDTPDTLTIKVPHSNTGKIPDSARQNAIAKHEIAELPSGTSPCGALRSVSSPDQHLRSSTAALEARAESAMSTQEEVSQIGDPRPSTPIESGKATESKFDDSELEVELRARARHLEIELAKMRQVRRRAIARAARCAYTEAPEVAWESPEIIDCLGRFNLLGLEDSTIERDSDLNKGSTSLYFSHSLQKQPIRRASLEIAGIWMRSPNRDISEFGNLEAISRDVPRSFRGIDRASGEPVLLKAYALDEGDDDAAWRKHEAEIDALLALPRHEAVAAPRSIVTAMWAPVHEIDTRMRCRVKSFFIDEKYELQGGHSWRRNTRSENTAKAADKSIGQTVESISGSSCPVQSTASAVMYLDFALAETDAVGWAEAASRAPWHVQSVARQILTAILVLHSHDVVHAHLTPRTVVLLGEARAQLATRHVLVANPGSADIAEEEFIAPEILRGESAPTTAGDMFSFAATLQWLHAVCADTDGLKRSRFSRVSSLPDEELRRLLETLMADNPARRPSAADALLHPYFQNSYMDRYIAGGDIVGPNEKLEALRDLLRQVRLEMRSLPGRRKIVVRRDEIVEDVLAHFSEQNVRTLQKRVTAVSHATNISSNNPSATQTSSHHRNFEPLHHHITRYPLRVTFDGEAGVDEGGLTVEMFRIFFDRALEQSAGLFESSGGDVVLPRPASKEPLSDRAAFISKMEAFGRALVTACYEGCGAPPRLGPSMFKFLARGARHVSAGDGRALRDLQKFDPQLGASFEYMLTHTPENGADWGLDFDDVSAAAESEQAQDSARKHQPRAVTEANKHSFVVLKVRQVLTACRIDSLQALRRGFESALSELSPEASPFLKLFSSTDWRVMLSSDDDDLTPEQVIDALKFVGFPRGSLIPDVLRRACESFSTDTLRRFLVFATGSPSLPRDSREFEIQVRAQPRSNALPVAHVCFFHIDMPDYEDEGTFITKLLTAIHECGTFDRV